MRIISLIAAMDEHRGIGKANQLLCHLPADLKHFKELTWGKPVIMGHKTYDSIGKALPGRLNIVLSRQSLLLDDATVMPSLQAAIALTQEEPEVMIIGGAQVFTDAMPLAQRMYITFIHAELAADVFFPMFDEKEWFCHSAVDRARDEKNSYDMTFCHYERY